MDVTKEYELFTQNYNFIVTQFPKKGKGITAKSFLKEDEEILQESPLVVWPISSSNSDITFCENCLKFSDYDGKRKLENSFEENFTKKARNENKFSTIFLNAYDSSRTNYEFQPSLLTDIRKPYFCSPICEYQALGENQFDNSNKEILNINSKGTETTFYSGDIMVDSKGNEDLEHIQTINSSLLNDSKETIETTDNVLQNKYKNKSSLSGWMQILNYENLLELRRVQSEVHPKNDQPITLEALGRVISKIASITKQFKDEMNLDDEQAYSLAWTTFDRLVHPTTSTFEDTDFSFPTSIFTTMLSDILEENLGKNITEHLLNENTIKIIFGKLTLNSQALNIWGAHSHGYLSVLKAAGIYTLQSCFNHCCDPNCSVSCLWDSTLSICTIKDVNISEELTISYIPTEITYAERKGLLDNFLFDCNCTRCCLKI